MKKILCIIVALMSLTGLFAQNYQGIIYVTPTGAGTQSGDSWANATPSIAQAKSLAQAHNCVVWVAKGVYYGLNMEWDNAFYITEGVDVYGGFVGNEPANYDLNLRDFVANSSILDGGSIRRVLYQSHDFNVPTTWDGFTIQNGRLSTNSTPSSEKKIGAGVYLRQNGILKNCIINNNLSYWCTDNKAGGIYADYATIDNCTISNNRSHDGGGIYAVHSTIINCQIFNNQGAYYGGGIYASSSNITNCQIQNNTCLYHGGGIAVRNNSMISECNIYNNSCTMGFGGGVYADQNSIVSQCDISFNANNQNWSHSHSGGGVYTDNSTITRCHIHHNTTPLSGGGGISSNGNSNISYCFVSNNTSLSIGGGVGLGGGDVLTNSLIVNNSVTGDYGSGGVYLDYGSTIRNSTIVKNTAQRNGAGISSYSGSYNVANCIIWGNESNYLEDNVGSMNSYYSPICSHSAIGGFCDGDNNIDISNMSIFINPSMTAGAEDNTDNLDWHLLPEAICINQGNNSVVNEDYDLDGLPRIACETVDMGCYEFYRVKDIYANSPNHYIWHDSTYSASGEYLWIGLLDTNCDSLEILHLTVDPTVNINSYRDSLDQLIIVYPNPTSNVVNVECLMKNEEWGDVELHLCDAYGRLLDVVRANDYSPLRKAQIDLSRYASGIYFVKAVADGKTIAVRKVVKQ